MRQDAYGRFAAVYDRLMQDVDYDGWSAYLHALLGDYGVPKNGRVLDCACGTGEISLRLARAGYTVTGLDFSEDMLLIAQEKARRAGFGAPGSLPFIRQDMRHIALHRPMDAIVCACDGVNYLTSIADVRAFALAAYAALKPGGTLLFDVSSRYKLAHVLGNGFLGEDQEDCAYLWQNAYDSNARLCEMRLTFFLRQGTLYERFTERHVQRAHSETELRHALEAAGFADIGVFAAFTRELPAMDCERLQFSARRPAATCAP